MSSDAVVPRVENGFVHPDSNGQGVAKKRMKRSSRTLSTGDASTVDAILLSKACPQLKKNSKRSRTGRGRGQPKKGGAGGKGTWGKLGSELVEDTIDAKDPNYDSETEKDLEFEAITPALNQEDLEKVVAPLVSEYFEHGDSNEVVMSLEELNLCVVRPELLALVIQLSMERKPSHREMASVLLSDMYERILNEKDYEKGFTLLFESLPDLTLDTPEAATWIGNFAARAVADDCLAPKFLQDSQEKTKCEKTRASCIHANALLKMPHGLVRLDNVWGAGGAMRPVQSLVKQIQLILSEYVVSADKDEAQRCVRELEVPHFHHEIVYEALVMAIEDMHDSAIDAIVKLLKFFDNTGSVTPQQMQRGFERVYSEMSDIVIDVPAAYSVLERIVDKCHKESFLAEKVVMDMPLRGRKRFVSEGDGGRVKDTALL